MIRWVKAHPYTTTTPFMLAAIVVLTHFALAIPWVRSLAFIGLIALIPVISAVVGKASQLK